MAIKKIFNEYSDLGFFPVTSICPKIKTADPQFNTDSIINEVKRYRYSGILLFPELCITGYTCGDLFTQQNLVDGAYAALERIREYSAESDAIIVVGSPLCSGNRLYNCGVVISGGHFIGAVPKTHIPNYSEFYEKRWFSPAHHLLSDIVTINEETVPFGTDIIFKTTSGVSFGLEICEDLWVANPPSTELCRQGAEIILNLSATDEVLGKHKYLLDLLRQQSARCRCGYAYASAGAGESSTDLVFSGNCILVEDGKILAKGERFSRTGTSATTLFDLEHIRHDRRLYNTYGDTPAIKRYREVKLENKLPEYPQWKDLLAGVDPHPFVPEDITHLDENCREILSIQSWGLEQRLEATGCMCLVVGISGGLDSTLALLVACEAFDRLRLPRKGIIGVTMPGLATTNRTKNNATELMRLLGVTCREIAIGKAVAQHFTDIGQDENRHDAAYENSQARERTQILMDLANKESGMVLGTGDLSELALGWCTYNGDQMSMYGINASVPKTLVRHLVSWMARYRMDEATRAVLFDIIDTPISPELIPGKENEISQKTEDLIGPYELHDFYLYHTLRYGSSPKKIYVLACEAFRGIHNEDTIKKWLISFYRRFFSQQFKRSCMPDGPKTGSVCLSPRGDWRMPSDASVALWRKESETL
ncbi:MAG: NAD(+) synthase [Clostridium sp.]|nr:NAD(+) synthase [Prevotella sp.]MCM1428716.1 NAD(+) synthase [Clostridium sp.]